MHQNSNERIKQLIAQLEIYQANLQTLQLKKAKFGSLHVPNHVFHEIQEAEDNIAHIQTELSDLAKVQSPTSLQGNRMTNASQQKKVPSCSIIIVIGLIASLITMYLFIKDDIFTNNKPIISTYRGTVVDRSTGLPIANARVLLQLAADPFNSVRTDAEGQYRFELALVGDTNGKIIVEAEGYARQEVDISVKPTQLQLQEIQIVRNNESKELPTIISLPQPTEASQNQNSTPGIELVVNGDFQQDWEVGWIREIDGEMAEAPQTTIVAIDNDSEFISNKGLFLSYEGDGELRLSQTVIVPNANIDFSATLFPAGFKGHCGTLDIWKCSGVAGILLNLNDDDGDTEGSIIYAHLTPDYPVNYADNTYFIPAPNKKSPISFNIRELTRERLPRVNIDKIKQIEVVIFIYSTDKCEKDSGCEGTLITSDVSLKIPKE